MSMGGRANGQACADGERVPHRRERNFLNLLGDLDSCLYVNTQVYAHVYTLPFTYISTYMLTHMFTEIFTEMFTNRLANVYTHVWVNSLLC